MTHGPPRLALAILNRLRSDGVSESLVGDLVEEFDKHVAPERGMFRARLWFWKQTLNVAVVRSSHLPAPASYFSNHSNAPEPMKAFLRDVGQATRGLLRTPGFTLVAVATLALGIGSNTAVYTVVRGVILSPLPYDDANRLVKVGGFIPGVGTQDLSGSPAELRDYQEHAVSFEGVTGAVCSTVSLGSSSREPQAPNIVANKVAEITGTGIIGFMAETPLGLARGNRSDDESPNQYSRGAL